MKIKRFFSQDMRSAIRMVREELGADAVILSNDRVNGGVEIVAAVDYDETILDQPGSVERSAQRKAPAQKNPVANQASRQTSKQSPKHSQTAHNSAQRSAQGNAAKNSQRNAQAAVIADKQHQNNNDLFARKDLDYQDYDESLLDDDDSYLMSENGSNPNLHNRIDSAFKPPAKHNTSRNPHSGGDEQNGFDEDFLTLDELSSLDGRGVNQSLYDVDKVQDFPKEMVANKKADGRNSYSVWSQEPTLMAMRNEITTLRGMLEQQLTGLAWNDLKKNNPLRAKLIKQLLELGFSPELADQIIRSNNVGNSNEKHDYRRAWQMTLATLAEKLPIKDDDVILSGGVVALVGVTGVGKTTTIAKLAARYALRHGRNSIVMVTTDTYRIGALEQLRTYGRILGIPVKIAHNKKHLKDLLKLLAEKKFVLIDTAGMGQRDMRLMEQFNVINDCAIGLKTLLVLSSTTHRAALDETIRSFSNVDINGCILTKLDETTNLGSALSVVTEHQLPVAYISDGQRVPEDLHLARAHTLINRSVTTARKANQPLDDDSLELAFSRMPSHASA